MYSKASGSCEADNVDSGMWELLSDSELIFTFHNDTESFYTIVTDSEEELALGKQVETVFFPIRFDKNSGNG
jgi:hypothetical protein